MKVTKNDTSLRNWISFAELQFLHFFCMSFAGKQ